MRPRRTEPRLFDLPLGPGGKESDDPAAAARRGSRRATPPESLPLFPEQAAAGVEEAASALADEAPYEHELPEQTPVEPLHAGPRALPEPPAAARPVAIPAPLGAAPLGSRARATLANLVVYAGLVALVWLGLAAMGRSLERSDLPAVALFLLAFSYLYTVIPLAFWGQTPGMVWAGLIARCGETEPLAFGQTTRRWLGGLLTMMFVGLPGLLALRGRSLTDRLSGSSTWLIEHRA